MTTINTIVFECPIKKDASFIKKALIKNKNVYVIEPFCAYHHKGKITYFPAPLPEFVDQYIKSGKIKMIAAHELGSRTTMLEAPEKAVSAVEQLFPEYFRDNEKMIRYIAAILKSDEAIKIYKKAMCDVLAEFYSFNALLNRLDKYFKGETILIRSAVNIKTYRYYYNLCAKMGYPIKSHRHIYFGKSKNMIDQARITARSLKIYLKLLAQTCASGFISWRNNKKNIQPKMYHYAISVHAPNRQLRNNQRGPDFLIDGKHITTENTIYITNGDLEASQFKKLKKLDSDIYSLHKAGSLFSNAKQWATLLVLAILNRPLANGYEVETAAMSFFNCFRWNELLKKISFKHYITHCDFGPSHISRNLVLKQFGVTTWYFTDAVNFGYGFRTSDEVWNRHPFWTYMLYDHFVTWYTDLVNFFSRHPSTFRTSHVIGCIWASHVANNSDRYKFIDKAIEEKYGVKFTVIAVFPSTYSVNGITSYDEGIEFIRHVKQLVEDLEYIYVVIKEKKELYFFAQFQPELGVQQKVLYEEMEKHPRINILTNQNDASQLMSIADVCVSFPFTSTTTEALSAGKKAIWHDPMGNYRNTPYAKIGGLVTHDYSELLTGIRKMTDSEKAADYEGKIANSQAMDPFCDGLAIERFRRLLVKEE